MARDRVFINQNYREKIDKIKADDILGFDMVENKESFMLAVALGLDNPEEVKNKDGWFLLKNLKTSDKALIASVLIGTANNDDEVDAYADLDKALGLCEKCAETGFKELNNRILKNNNDRELLERKMLKELDLLYMNNVENNI